MLKQSRAQKETVGRVMHEFKHGELKQAGGRRVKNPKQAIAIALHEAGASNQESPRKNRENLKKTKAKELAAQTGRGAAQGDGRSKAELYSGARKRDIPGRSRMDKQQLQRALAR
jgi:hypothetical protein